MTTQTQTAAPLIFEYEYYARLHDIEEKHWWAHGMRDAMLSLLDKPLANRKSIKVLDIGCGTGLLLNYIKEHYPVKGEPVGLDISEHAIKFCEQRGAKELILGSATEVPLPDESFDLIICIDTIQHLSPAGSDQVALDEFMRLLKPGGIVYLRTNSSLGHVKLSGVDADQYRRYDVPGVNSMLRDAGFMVLRATYLNFVASSIAAVREFFTHSGRNDGHGHHGHGHHGHSDGTQHEAAIGPGLKIKAYPPSLAWLNSILYQWMRIEAWMIRMGFDLPFGHSCGFVARKPALVQKRPNH